MREIQIVVTCDRCGGHTDESMAWNVEIHRTDGVIFEADICEDCWTDWMGNARVRAESGEYACGYMDCRKVFKTARGLGKHQTVQGH